MRIIQNEHFCAEEIQLDGVRNANRSLGLGLSDDHFIYPPEPPPWSEKPLTALTLVMRLPDRYGKSGFERTVEEYWRRITWPGISMGGRLARMPDMRFDPEHLVDLSGQAWKPGLSWAVLDLGAGIFPGGAHSPLYASLMALSGKQTLPGLEVLAAAAMHPHWLQAMDGKKVPFVWMPGLQLRIDGVDHCKLPYTPALMYRQDEAVTNLTASPSSERDPRFAVPRLLWRTPDTAN